MRCGNIESTCMYEPMCVHYLSAWIVATAKVTWDGTNVIWKYILHLSLNVHFAPSGNPLSQVSDWPIKCSEGYKWLKKLRNWEKRKTSDISQPLRMEWPEREARRSDPISFCKPLWSLTSLEDCQESRPYRVMFSRFEWSVCSCKCP